MKHFLYISDTKVDLLHAQLPKGRWKRLTANLTIDLKYVKKEFGSGDAEASRVLKLMQVIRYIEQYEEVGTVDAPKVYFKDTVAARWGPYGFRRQFGRGRELVYFGAITERTVLGLCGSTRHVVGNIGSNFPDAGSATPFIMAMLDKEFTTFTGDRPMTRDVSDASSLPTTRERRRALESQRHWPMALKLATSSMKGPLQQLEFLTKKLACSAPEGRQAVLLGTPLYVALAD